jgi:hypothetical protein
MIWHAPCTTIANSTALKHQNQLKISPTMTNQIESSDTAKAPEEILHPDSRSLFRYWEGARRENSAPTRADIDLKMLKNILPWLGILERHPLKPEYTWRLAGTGICRLWAHELTGKLFHVDNVQHEDENVAQLMDNVMASHQPCIARFRAAYEEGELLGLEMLCLPVLANDGRTTQMFASMVPFHKPHWLGTRQITKLQLSSVRMIWTEHQHQTLRRAVPPRLVSSDRQSRPVFSVIEGGRGS